MRSIKDILKDIEVPDIEETLKFRHKWLNEGWTHASNRLLRDNSVSSQARFLYILLMSRAFKKDFSYPGEETLAVEMGVTRMSVSSYKKELIDKHWITVKRRGLGKTNIYFLEKYK